MSQEQNSSKMRSSDRVLVVRPIEGKTAISTTGLLDNRLFTGGNTLHATMETESCLWRLRYDTGVLPEQLKQKFTSFRLLKQHADRYFLKRNLEIVEVKD